MPREDPCLDADVSRPSAARESQRWFSEEVHTHESSLRAYLRGAFPGIRDLDDVVQESYLRIWKARLTRTIVSTKPFLFQIARNLAFDVVRRRRAREVGSAQDPEETEMPDSKVEVIERICREEKVEMLAAAFVHLPPRCRAVMTLRKLKGMSNREIAEKLGVTEGTVECQVNRGIKLCRDYLRARGVSGFERE